MKWNIVPANDFNNYAEHWDNLNRSGPHNPVLDSSFVSFGLAHFGNGDEVLASFEENGEITAMSVLCKQKQAVWSTFQPSQAPVGFWINNSSTPIKALLKKLASSLPGFVLRIGLTQQDPNIYPRPEKSFAISSIDYISTARIDTSNVDFESYWKNRGKNLRQNMNKLANRLEREGANIRMEEITSPDEIPKAINQYGILETLSWKADEGTAVSSDNNQGRFYTDLLQHFCKNHQGVIYQYYIDDELAASDICIILNGVLVILKTSFNEKYKKSSPAFLMRKRYFPDIFVKDSLKSIEFYGKTMDWHTKWSNDIRLLYHINFNNIPLL
ncbi:MAG: GNAT family N-acetyltransferase [Motiliproteus sp.]|nr:GNAT family N-acetyltransferase [Motiliproteus sp.]MCW9053174.1 GNAT family N-acetyltransferase [Motiliproteus sp.]